MLSSDDVIITKLPLSSSVSAGVDYAIWAAFVEVLFNSACCFSSSSSLCCSSNFF